MSRNFSGPAGAQGFPSAIWSLPSGGVSRLEQSLPLPSMPSNEECAHDAGEGRNCLLRRRGAWRS